MSRMVDRFPLRLMAGLGVASVVAGFIWGVLNVGVPYPDPTPAQKAAERFHMRVLDALVCAGIVLLLVSGVLALVRRFARPSGATGHGNAPEDRPGRS